MKSTAEFVRLWTMHQAQVAAYIATLLPRPDSAAEVLQQVSVALWEKWAEYDLKRPFVPWAIRFAYLEVLKWRQGQARERLVFCDTLLEQLHGTYEAEAPLEAARQQALGKCLEKLNPQERLWVQRRYAAGESLKQNAGENGLSMHQIYYAMEQIRARLLNCITRSLREEGWIDA
jgi:RNA polymerase sigma-70 factor (ECF subfamily)